MRRSRGSVSRWRRELRRAVRFVRRPDPLPPEAPEPPSLPPGRTVPVPGRGEVFVRHRPGPGGSPTIVLLHGWTATADINWWRAYDAVGRLGAVVAPDHRGHGRGIRSEAPFTLEDAADDVAGLLRVLGTGPAVICGYSMGGPIAMLLWRRHPELVSGLVLQATALEWRASSRERLLWKGMGAMEHVLRWGAPHGLLDRAVHDVVEEDPALRAHRAWLLGELRRGDPGDLADAGRAIGGYDGRPFAGEVDVPTAVVVTRHDRLVRPRKQRALARAIPDAARFEIDGDHDVCVVRSGPFVQVTVEAITSVLGRGSARPARRRPGPARTARPRRLARRVARRR